MRWMLTLIMIPFLGWLTIDAKPAPKAPAEKKQAEFLTGPTIWGELSRAGNVLNFRGHDTWSGTGEIIPGKGVRIIWTHIPTGNACPGAYQIGEDGIMYGKWGWAPGCTVDDECNLTGPCSDDAIVRPAVVEPPID